MAGLNSDGSESLPGGADVDSGPLDYINPSSFTVNMPVDQAVAMLQQVGFQYSPLDTALGKTGFGHPGTNMRDQNHTCSVHANITPANDNTSATISFHTDFYNPLGPALGGDRMSTGIPMHVGMDVVPDLGEKAGITSWTGNQLCQ